MLSDDQALELARRLPAVFRFFPSRNPQVLAEVALVFAELIENSDQGEMVYQALLSRGGDWQNVPYFRRQLTGAIAAIAGGLAERSGGPIPPGQVQPICAECPFNTGCPLLEPPARQAGIDWAEKNCPDCPLLGTAYLLRDDDLAHA